MSPQRHSDIGLKLIERPTLAFVALICAQCGQENPDWFRFVGHAGPLAEAAAAQVEGLLAEL
jgi:hypothetical protein